MPVVLASTVGEIFSPFFHAMSWLLALYYSLIPNYVVAIAMLTITVMILSFPLNRASTRSMFKMQLLQPEVQKLRNRYKPGRDATVQERQEMRQKLNEEMMALYRENNVSMAGGCLPNLVIFPIFIVLYDVIRGLTNTCTALAGQTVCASSAALKGAKNTHVIWFPRYIIQNSALYRNLFAAHGKMLAFGINLASTVRTSQKSWVDILPFVAFVAVAVVLQFIQLRQMSGRSTQTGQVAQQMQAMQKVMPLIMAVIYINIPAAVNIYFIFSSLFRIGQQEWMYRRDPQITRAFAQLKARKAAAAQGGGAKKKPGTATEEPSTALEPFPPGGLRGFRSRLANALAPEGLPGATDPPAGSRPATRKPDTGGGAAGRRPSTGKPAGTTKPAGGAAKPGASGTTKGTRPAGGAAKPGTAGTAKPGGSKPGGGKPAGGAGGKPPAGDATAGNGRAKPARGESNGTSSNGTAGDDGDSRSQPTEEGKRPRRPR